MPSFSMRFETRKHSFCTVEADTAEEATALLNEGLAGEVDLWDIIDDVYDEETIEDVPGTAFCLTEGT